VLLQLKDVGNKLMAAESVALAANARQKIRMDFSAILNAKLAIKVLVPSAGKTVIQASVMMVPSVQSPSHMAVVLVHSNSAITVRRTDFFGTPNANQASTPLDAAFALPTARQV
jgi:hypothetical protein